MKKHHSVYFFIFAILLCTQIFSQSNAAPEKTGNLIVIISGLKNTNGDLKIGLFNSSASYDGQEERFRGADLKIDSLKVEWILKDIPFGEYAIKVFHDEDRDNDIDTNFLGIPKEAFGFSNNPKLFFKPPDFEKAKFAFNSNAQRIEIKLK